MIDFALAAQNLPNGGLMIEPSPSGNNAEPFHLNQQGMDARILMTLQDPKRHLRQIARNPRPQGESLSRSQFLACYEKRTRRQKSSDSPLGAGVPKQNLSSFYG